jgi:hypothetical protein
LRPQVIGAIPHAVGPAKQGNAGRVEAGRVQISLAPKE